MVDSGCFVVLIVVYCLMFSYVGLFAVVCLVARCLVWVDVYCVFYYFVGVVYVVFV